MKNQFRAVAALAAVAVVLAACGVQPGSRQGGGFENRYLVARNALDAGRYDVAISGFENLIADASNPMVTRRLTLELAHSQLRQGDYARAAETARSLAGVAEGEARALALAVAGTADHEQARQRMAAGQVNEARALLTLAETDLTEMLELGAGLDAGGAMAQRLQLVRAELGR